MRKMKKINGYLVVRFNDREKREYEGTGLGNFGVIDAELYTGILDVDRSVMEYDDAETLEIALEQARSLESELDVVEPEVKITVIIEGETEVSEEDVEPESLFKGQRATLEAQLKHGPHLDLDPLTAAHELHGYARALEDLGMIDGHDERFLVERNTFGEVCNLYTDEGHRVNVALPSRAGLAIVSPHDFEEGGDHHRLHRPDAQVSPLRDGELRLEQGTGPGAGGDPGVHLRRGVQVPGGPHPGGAGRDLREVQGGQVGRGPAHADTPGGEKPARPVPAGGRSERVCQRREAASRDLPERPLGSAERLQHQEGLRPRARTRREVPR